MPNTIAIRREDLSKKGEKRVAIPPRLLPILIDAGVDVIVQSNIHPKSGEEKRAFTDEAYQQFGAKIQEDLSEADVIFGLKEVEIPEILPNKAYLFFSHTHKGQVKNRSMLQELVDKKTTLIDYELIVNSDRQRILTSFTYFAGYAGMIDSLWTFGKRMAQKGIDHIFQQIPQSVEWQDLDRFQDHLQQLGDQISKEGTPESLPPFITCFLGNGKTSTGAQEIYDLLPTQSISMDELEETMQNGSRKQIYKLVLDIPEMYRLTTESQLRTQKLSHTELFDAYLQQPQHFETNLESVFPYCSMMMNCILWSSKYPRLLSLSDTASWYSDHKTLEVIGDITCDPQGAIEFSQETWIDQPVFVYNPKTNQSQIGLAGEGIAVMAVTNLPCEFPADASDLFGRNLEPLLAGIATADFQATDFSASGLPDPIQGACILWKGAFTPEYAYMAEYLKD